MILAKGSRDAKFEFCELAASIRFGSIITFYLFFFLQELMASRHNLLQQTKSESPAKIFAKLKSRVQRESMCAKDGVLTDKDPPWNVREKHGAEFNSPRKTAECIWKTHDLGDNDRLGSYGKEVQAFTLSPISSPQKTFPFSAIDSKHVDRRPPVSETGHIPISIYGHTTTKGSFLESTAVSHPLSVVNREQIHAQPTQVRDLDGYKATSRTPVKIQPVQHDCIRSVFEEECASQDKLMSPSNVYSPMRKRLRKRKWEQDFGKVSSSTKGISNEIISQSRERKTSSILTDNIQNSTCMEELNDVRGLPAEQLEMNQYTHELMFPLPRSTAKKRCCVITENVPVMSPAKMFAYMKERESKREQQGIHEVHSSTRQLFSGGNFGLSRDTSLFTADNVDKIENIAYRSATESVVPVKHSRAENTEKQCNSSEDGLVPVVQSQPVFFEDPLVLNSPRISIPNKHQTVFKRKNLQNCEKFPNECVIYLKQWFLRRTHKGLFVDGIHRDENIPWNSNFIVDRVSNSVVKTVTGRVYILVGKMKPGMDSGFPKWFLKKFVNGFPPNWKMLYEKLLLESRHIETENNNKGRNSNLKKKSESSSINISVKREKQKSFKTPNSSPPASSATKVSRSGRVIKPPLEYWKGGRVILDAYMNVSILERYDTPICISEDSTTVSAGKSQKPTRVFIPCSEGHKHSESDSKEEVSLPLRKVKAPLRKRNRAKINSKDSPLNPSEPSVEQNSSPEEYSARKALSSRRSPATEKMLLNTVAPKQRVPKKASTHPSKRHTHDTGRLPVSQRKRSTAWSPESLTGIDQTLQQQLSDNESFVKRKTRGKGEHRKRHGKAKPNTMSSSCQSSENSEESTMKLRKRTKICDAAQTQKKVNKTSPATKPPAKSVQSSKKHMVNKHNAVVPQEEDDDKWTEAELMKLQQAVSHYPKHMTGYWAKVARIVGTRSAAECHLQYTSQGTSQTPTKKAKKPKKEQQEAAKNQATDHPVISARAGTFKRKQQVRKFLEAMPREEVDDVFSSAYMQSKRFEIPSMCQSDDHDFPVSDLKPLTPMSKLFPEVKTPQCLHITPGMMGSPNRNSDDKYVFQLQKRMKKNQFNVCKNAPLSKSFTPTPSVKRTMRRCENTENDSFVIWEMFPGNEGALLESEEEEDFYFSDND
ncbi:Mis18-binding protein 1 Kinetochore-associated protein KNL-2 -like protein [Channa argus]|uniref:Mis18-binding protein 1 Kinetochore-associated protein KNL-2-like protein n=1 Tax=Channa argus TaxID=215402 RepID=A0A6G1QFD9_CHAAH|nr:Mis18-binding protein 1 Kinetochore-associated protein KNL-2 -like protein [Channa argus]